jgi:hypothetical protein
VLRFGWLPELTMVSWLFALILSDLTQFPLHVGVVKEIPEGISTADSFTNH